MIYIFLAVCCSVLVSVLLKLARRYDIDTRQAIGWNYAMAGALAWLVYRPALPEFTDSLLPVYLGLGLLLPSLFVILALSVRHTGIVRTDIAQRLSLFIPILAAFILFGEDYSQQKLLGIGIAFTAILCSIPWHKDEGSTASGWVYPVIVFIGMGIIDIFFKQIAAAKTVPFPSALLLVFILAFGVSMAYLLIQRVFFGMKFTIQNLVCGLILGIFNFGNILFYLKAHQALSNDPSAVFSAMNVGVIVLGTLVGVGIFREKLSKINYFGIILAVVAIIIIALNK